MWPVAKPCASELEQALRVATRNLLSILRADWQSVQEGSSRGVRIVWIVHRKEYSVGTGDMQGTKEWRQGEASARSNVEVLVKIIGNAAFEMRRALAQERVGANNVERQRFPHVPDNDLEFGKMVEQTGNDQAQAMHPGFRMPPPAGGGKDKSRIGGQSAEICFPHFFRWRRGVQVNWNVQCLRRFEERRKARVVEKQAVGGSIDESALESQLPDTPFEFEGRLLRLLQREGREGGKAVRVGLHGVCKLVVRVPRQGGRKSRIESVQASG